MNQTPIGVAKAAAQFYLEASKVLDEDDLNIASTHIRQVCEAHMTKFGPAAVDQIFDDVAEKLIEESIFGAPTNEDICRAVLELKEVDA